MTIRARWKRWAVAWCWFGAWAVAPRESPAAPAAPVGVSVLSEKEVAGRAAKLAAAEKASRGARDAAAKSQERMDALNAARKKAVLELADARREVERRLQAGKAAQQKFQASRKGRQSPAFDALDTARKEYAAAQAAGGELKKAAGALAATDSELEATAKQAEAAALQAQASADEAKALAQELQLVASAAKDAANGAKATAKKARGQSGFATATAFTSAKARADADAAKTEASLATANKELAGLSAFKQASEVVVTGCDANDEKGSWRPPEGVLAAAVLQTQGGMCGVICGYGPPIAEAATKCAAKRRTTLISLSMEKNPACVEEYAQPGCGLTTRGLELGARHFIAINTAPGGDYALDVLEVKGDKVVPYYSGAPYVDVACHKEFPPSSRSGMTPTMRAEWRNPPPALRLFICGF